MLESKTGMDQLRIYAVGPFLRAIFKFKFSPVLCRSDPILLFEIPDELGGIGIADGFTDIIQFQVRGLQKLLRPV